MGLCSICYNFFMVFRAQWSRCFNVIVTLVSFETMANSMLRRSQISGTQWRVSAAEKTKFFLCKPSVTSLFLFSEIKAYHNEKINLFTVAFNCIQIKMSTHAYRTFN